MWSRDLQEYHPDVVRHITDALVDVDLVLDGEFYLHGKSLQWINGRITPVRTSPHNDSHLVQYHIFDCVKPHEFNDRHKLLLNHVQETAQIKLVKTIFCANPSVGDRAHKLFLKQNYEGTMYRDGGFGYGRLAECGNKENRWKCLKKRKDMQDLVATLEDFIEGEGRLRGSLGALRLRTSQGIMFQAGTGLTDSERQHIWDNQDLIPENTQVRINYEMLSDTGVPLKPVIESVDYEI